MRYALVILLMILSGCDKLTGVTAQKNSDAEAIGYACRVSLKKPEDCMKDNDAQSTTAILTGWKSADKDIAERTLDPSMGADPTFVRSIAPASAPVEIDAASDVKATDTKDAKVDDAKTGSKGEDGKPAKTDKSKDSAKGSEK